MPLLNWGTLIENVAVIAASRVAIREALGRRVGLVFASSFSLPPLSRWRESNTPEAFSQAMMSALAKSPPSSGLRSYHQLLRRCVRKNPTDGPNAALLVGMQARLLECPLHLWLNDLKTGADVPNTIEELGRINMLVTELCDDSEFKTELLPEVSGIPFPKSIAALVDILRLWEESQGTWTRVGFLDPDGYRQQSTNPRQTTAASHRQWLAALRTDAKGPVLSVHFTEAGRTPKATRIDEMHKDGLQCGYSASVGLSMASYAVNVNIWHPTGEREAQVMRDRIREQMAEEWEAWRKLSRRLLERRPRKDLLELYEDGMDVRLTEAFKSLASHVKLLSEIGEHGRKGGATEPSG